MLGDSGVLNRPLIAILGTTIYIKNWADISINLNLLFAGVYKPIRPYVKDTSVFCILYCEWREGGQFWFCVVCMPRTADTGEVRLSGLAMA